MKRLLGSMLVAMVLPVVGVGVAAAPAHACSCAGVDDLEAFASADAVFVGRLIGYEAPRPPISSSLDPAVWTFKVRQVYKGKVSKQQEVVSAVSGASCGLELPKYGKFLVFASTSSNRVEPRPARGQLQANLCGGTRVLDERFVDPSFGRPHPPGRVSAK